MESAEEIIEEFWSKVYGDHVVAFVSLDKSLACRHTKAIDFNEFVCINKLKVCCQKGHYGKDCKKCPGAFG